MEQKIKLSEPCVEQGLLSTEISRMQSHLSNQAVLINSLLSMISKIAGSDVPQITTIIDIKENNILHNLRLLNEKADEHNIMIIGFNKEMDSLL